MNKQRKIAWADLPNAPHIARILTDIEDDPDRWVTAWNATQGEDWNTSRGTAWESAWDAACESARAAARDAAWDAAWTTALGACIAARLSARSAIAALVAWDNCAHLLDTNPEQVQVLALMGHNPAIFLLPAIIALSKTPIDSMSYHA